MGEFKTAGLYWVIHYHHEDHYARRVAVVGVIEAWQNPPVVRCKWDRDLNEVRRVFTNIHESMLKHIRYCQDRLELTVRDAFNIHHDVRRVEKAMDSLDRPYWKLSYVPGRATLLYEPETPNDRIKKSFEHLMEPPRG